MSTWLIISIVALALSALFSGVEIAFVTSERVRVEIDARQGGIIGSILSRFYANSEMFISTVLVGNNIVLVVYGMGMAALLEPWIMTWAGGSEALVLIAQTIISTAIILLMGEFVPKTMFKVNPNNSIRIFAIPIYLIYYLLFPISWLATKISRGLMSLLGMHNQEDGFGVITLGELNDYLEDTIDNLEDQKEEVENEVKIFQNALDFSTRHLGDCLIPRNEMVTVSNDTPREELVEKFTETGRSKILVYRDDIDDIIGYIHVSELLDPSKEWQQQIKPVLFAPETLMANKMMRRLLTEKKSIAIVIDEFGGTAGMVTLEDLVEEIFGDIQDEHDDQQLVARKIDDNTYELAGRCEIPFINDNFHLDIPEDDEYQTIAGYILAETGTIPAKGEVMELGDYKIEILKKSANRIELVRLTKLGKQS